MTAPNPYETDVQPTDNAKAFSIGQSLSRVHFHLVQSVFLDDFFLAPIPGAMTAKQHGCLWRAAALSIRARLEFNVHPPT